MFDPNRLAAALRAIHRVLVHARTLVGDGASSAAVYQLLDRAEILPTFLTPERPDATTDEFRDALVALVDEFPEARGILNDYDADRGIYATTGAGY